MALPHTSNQRTVAHSSTHETITVWTTAQQRSEQEATEETEGTRCGRKCRISNDECRTPKCAEGGQHRRWTILSFDIRNSLFDIHHSAAPFFRAHSSDMLPRRPGLSLGVGKGFPALHAADPLKPCPVPRRARRPVRVWRAGAVGEMREPPLSCVRGLCSVATRRTQNTYTIEPRHWPAPAGGLPKTARPVKLPRSGAETPQKKRPPIPTARCR
jgi:hypothetical protein